MWVSGASLRVMGRRLGQNLAGGAFMVKTLKVEIYS